MLLDVVWEALEDAGFPADQLVRSPTGVFIGMSTHDYGDLQVDPSRRHLLDAHCSTGTALSIAANRISYVYDLRGPSLVVDTACSSSLTAVHLACRSLGAGKCDLAIAGGVNAFLNPETAIGLCKASMLSPDGRCMAFDARANGFVRGEGAGVIVLKSLARACADGDHIYAVVRGSAVNQDGRTVGITVPNPDLPPGHASTRVLLVKFRTECDHLATRVPVRDSEAVIASATRTATTLRPSSTTRVWIGTVPSVRALHARAGSKLAAGSFYRCAICTSSSRCRACSTRHHVRVGGHVNPYPQLDLGGVSTDKHVPGAGDESLAD